MNEQFKTAVDFACSQKALTDFLQEGFFYFEPVRDLFPEKQIDVEDIRYLLSKITTHEELLALSTSYWVVFYTLNEIEDGLDLLTDKFAEIIDGAESTALYNSIGALYKLIGNKNDKFRRALESQKIKPENIKYLINKLDKADVLLVLTRPEVDRLTMYCLDNVLMDKHVFERYYDVLSERRKQLALGIRVLEKSDLISHLFSMNLSSLDVLEVKNIVEESESCQELDKEEQSIRREFDERLYSLSQRRKNVDKQVKKNTSLLETLNQYGVLNQHTKESIIEMLTKDRKKKKIKLNF